MFAGGSSQGYSSKAVSQERTQEDGGGGEYLTPHPDNYYLGAAVHQHQSVFSHELTNATRKI